MDPAPRTPRDSDSDIRRDPDGYSRADHSRAAQTDGHARLARPLAAITSVVIEYPWAVVAGAVALAVLSIMLTLGWFGTQGLKFKANRGDLISQDSRSNQLFIEFTEEFGSDKDVIVVVKGDSRDKIIPVLNEISDELANHGHLFEAVLHEIDFSSIRPKGLYYAPPKELAALEQFVAQVEPIYRDGNWGRLTLDQMFAGTSMRLAACSDRPQSAEYRELLAEMDRMSSSLLTSLGSGDPNGLSSSNSRTAFRSPWPEMPGSIETLSELNSQYLIMPDGRKGLVLLRLVKSDGEQFVQDADSIATLRQLTEGIEAKLKDHGVTIGLCGLPITESEEMRLSQSAMTRASVLSLFGVACLFVAGLGGLRHPLMTVAALLLAVAWSFGYITLTIGHLNILSISFGVILIGLGIDFGIHYVARYLQLRSEHHSCRESIIRASSSVGPGIITGAITTAIAFFTAGFTEFTGVAELGVIAGGGIVLCCVAAIFLLPAMLSLSDSQRVIRVMPAPLDIHGWLRPIFRRPGTTFWVTLIGTLFVAQGIGLIWYDHNLLNMQPEGLECIELERELIEGSGSSDGSDDSGQSVLTAQSIGTRAEVIERKKQFEALTDTVAKVEEIASIIPQNVELTQPIIARVSQRLQGLPERPPQLPVAPPEILGRQLAGISGQLGSSPDTEPLRRQLAALRDTLRRMSAVECERRLSDFQYNMAGDLLSRLDKLRQMADPKPPELSDLPEGLVTRFYSHESERYLLKISPKGDVWDMATLEPFVRDLRSVDPDVTGTPIQTYEASRSMQHSYQMAAIYALLAITVVLLLDLRSVQHVLLAMIPLALGMAQMFGLLGLLDIPLNPANMIVLPLILGIGVDDGVHVIHDYRNQRGPYRMSASTASAVLITSLTTMVGFGSLMIASHRGLQSLGRVLTIGVTCCLFTSLIMLPSLLVWISRHRKPVDEESSEHPGRSHRGQSGHAPHRSYQPGQILRHTPRHDQSPDSSPIRPHELSRTDQSSHDDRNRNR